MKLNLKIDLQLIVPAVVLILIGLTTLASINVEYLRSQLFSLSIGVIMFFLFIQLDFSSLIRLQNIIYIISLFLLLVVLFLGIESRGAMRWIELFGVRLQLSEIFKPLLALSFAGYIAGGDYLTIKKFFFAVLFLVPVFLLIFFQPDLGNALIYLGVFMATLIVVGFSLRWFLFLLIPFLLTLPFLWTLLHDYQRARVLTFLNPGSDPMGASYNSIQAIIAVGSGKLIGKGLGESTQSGLLFLPERHTDFIFATLCESMGLMGAMIVIAAFVFLLYRIIRIFNMSHDMGEKVFLCSAFFFFFVQFVVNIGMNIGLLPVVGVTLPFVSFGGSSLLASFIFLAIISSISISSRNNRVLEI